MINLYGTFNNKFFLKFKGGFNEKKYSIDTFNFTIDYI